MSAAFAGMNISAAARNIAWRHWVHAYRCRRLAGHAPVAAAAEVRDAAALNLAWSWYVNHGDPVSGETGAGYVIAETMWHEAWELHNRVVARETRQRWSGRPAVTG